MRRWWVGTQKSSLSCQMEGSRNLPIYFLVENISKNHFFFKFRLEMAGLSEVEFDPRTLTWKSHQVRSTPRIIAGIFLTVIKKMYSGIFSGIPQSIPQFIQRFLNGWISLNNAYFTNNHSKNSCRNSHDFTENP